MRGKRGEQRRNGASSRGGGVYWDTLPEHWLEHYPQRLWRRHSDSVNSALIERWLPAEVQSVLKTDLFDEAVSGGLYATLAARATRVVGIDASSAIVSAARARHAGLIGRRADVRDLPFADAEFDAVVSNSTLDHFESRSEIVIGLRELGRVLRPGGTLVLTLDNPWNPILGLTKMLPRRALNRAWFRVGGTSVKAGLLPYYVGATLSVRRLHRLLPTLGFTVLETGAVVHAPRRCSRRSKSAVDWARRSSARLRASRKGCTPASASPSSNDRIQTSCCWMRCTRRSTKSFDRS